MNVEDIPENANLQTANFQTNRKKQINYDDILKNMGMVEVKGKLFWEKEKINEAKYNGNFVQYEPEKYKKNVKKTNFNQNSYINQNPHINQNSYIHNKYFKNEFKEEPIIQTPKNLIEYRNMLIRQIIEKKRIEQLKSRQMIFR